MRGRKPRVDPAEVVRMILKLSMRETLLRAGRDSPASRRLAHKPDPKVYDEVAKRCSLSRDRVSHLANDRVLWKKVRDEYWSDFHAELSRRLDAALAKSAPKKAVPSARVLSAERRSERDQRKKAWLDSISAQAARGAITGEEAALLRKEIYAEFEKSKVT